MLGKKMNKKILLVLDKSRILLDFIEKFFLGVILITFLIMGVAFLVN